MFSNHFITNFPQNVPVKNVENGSTLGEDMDKICGLLFWPNLYFWLLDLDASNFIKFSHKSCNQNKRRIIHLYERNNQTHSTMSMTIRRKQLRVEAHMASKNSNKKPSCR